MKVAAKDEEGFYLIVDRKKDLIIRRSLLSCDPGWSGSLRSYQPGL